jgi:IS605 OrfB family transposase
VQLTLPVKLAPTSEQQSALVATIERFNAACDWIGGIAFRERCANKVALQKIVYYDTRARFGLAAQLSIRAISKVVEAYKRDRSICPRFRPHGAVPYDERIMSWRGVEHVSLLTLGGRAVVPVVLAPYQAARIDRRRGQADLIYRDCSFYLYVTVEVPEPPIADAPDYLGVDLGIVNIAADSDGNTHASGHVNGLRHRHRRLRGRLQAKGTRSAKRLLKLRRRQERRFSTDVNHTLSKRIVAEAQGTGRGIALEDLQGIRDRVSVRRPQRATLHGWAFNQLGQFIAYKARLAGVPLVSVDPRNTSRTCPVCGLVDKRNRVKQAQFQCVGCGFAGPADTIAALNIRARGRAASHAAVRRGCGVNESKHLAASSRALARSS